MIQNNKVVSITTGTVVTKTYIDTVDFIILNQLQVGTSSA